MALLGVAVKGSLLASATMLIGLFWLARWGLFESEDLSEKAADHFMAGGAIGPRPLLSRALRR